ncbi:heat shock protein HtpX [Halogranum gelatinilyticum]|uniref:Heat shock protein HtpX n=1 Tax=Halogranum gelatinilyticum TaxID=660521 RepID=A0A1G9QFZ0_9EURY|nr:M48 family metalloprotease [Halogranum gelatinilyticum]SDM09938.1 heat shock protein HtpX [Halogranum gelatinilyticum]
MGHASSWTLPVRAGVSLVTSLFMLLAGLGLVAAVGVVVAMLLSTYAAEFLALGQVTVPEEWWWVLWAVAGSIAVGLASLTVVRFVRSDRERLVANTRPPGDVSVERQLERTVDRLALQLGLKPPTVRVREMSQPLAYTTVQPREEVTHRRSEADFIVVSSGLLELLTADELRAVLAHELAHIANHDSRLYTMIRLPLLSAETLLPTDGRPSNLIELVAALLASVAAINVGIFARSRELAADRAAALLTGNPAALASALDRISDESTATPSEDLRQYARTTSSIATVPVTKNYWGASLTTLHPSLESRLAQLQAIEAEAATA